MEFNLVLGSKSPRRLELLKMADLDFEIRTADVEEVYPKDLDQVRIPEYLAALKAEALKPVLSKDDMLLTADTIVLLDGEIFEKPANEEKAVAMIGRLTGNMHQVITGVQLMIGEKKFSFSITTKVWFRELTEEQIRYYVSHYKPLDKAGAYAIQEWIGVVAVEKIEGDIYSVIGLPIGSVVRALDTFRRTGDFPLD